MSILSNDEYDFWQENGYVVIPNAVPQENLDAVVDALWAFLEMDPDDPSSWYSSKNRNHSMVEMYHHQSMWNNRQHPRVYGAFADIWQREDLWVSIDRVGFNPPARADDWDYHGFVHWDIDTSIQPVPFKVQGVLYLADTSADQGGFQCVPGFHNRFDEWVQTQPADRDPWRPDLTGLDVQAIPGKAGDLLIWHSLLPHGNGRNSSDQPRLCQYITMFPPRGEEERKQRIASWQERTPPSGSAFPGDPRQREQKSGEPAHLTALGRRLLGLE